MKIWFFTEGDSETNLVISLMRRSTPQSIRINDEMEFSQGSQSSSYYCDNCEGIDKIPHRINSINYRIENGNIDKIIIVGDIEKLKCASSRINKIKNILKHAVNQTKLHYILCRPQIEAIYWEHPELIKKLLKRTYKEIYGKELHISSLPGVNKDYKFKLRQIFNKYNIKYRPSHFSERFFSQVPIQSSNETIRRFHTLISELH